MAIKYGYRCMRDELYDLRRGIREGKFDPIDIYKQVERIAANECCNRCLLRKTMRQFKKHENTHRK